jgi:serine/threonine protein kinase
VSRPEDQPTMEATGQKPGARDDDSTLLTSAVTTGVPPSPVAPIHFAPGAIIAGRYRLVALLGKGGMGEVYRADDLILDQPVALKFLPPGADNDARLSQFHNECASRARSHTRTSADSTTLVRPAGIAS